MRLTWIWTMRTAQSSRQQPTEHPIRIRTKYLYMTSRLSYKMNPPYPRISELSCLLRLQGQLFHQLVRDQDNQRLPTSRTKLFDSWHWTNAYLAASSFNFWKSHVSLIRQHRPRLSWSMIPSG